MPLDDAARSDDVGIRTRGAWSRQGSAGRNRDMVEDVVLCAISAIDAVVIGVGIEDDGRQRSESTVVGAGGITREGRLLRGRCRASGSRMVMEGLHDESAESYGYAVVIKAGRQLQKAQGEERSVWDVRETRRWEECEEEGGTKSSRKTSAAD